MKDEKGHDNIDDERKPPDKERLRAFKAGWNEATQGKLYTSIKKKRTHQNMGNLFGWIYGESSDELKEKVWGQYIEVNKEFLGKDW